jgi:hypothetical protein
MSNILSQPGLNYGDTYSKDLTIYAISYENEFGILGYIPLNTFL